MAAAKKTRFSKWALSKVKGIGGLSTLCDRMPEYDRKTILSWIHGVQVPGCRPQLALCRALDCEMVEIRSALGKPYSAFSELLLRKILPYGNSAEFPRKTGIQPTTYEKWIAEGRLPVGATRLQGSDTLQEIADALILWGDTTPRPELMAELISAVQSTIESRKNERSNKRSNKRVKNNISPKISKDCDFGKIAS